MPRRATGTIEYVEATGAEAQGHYRARITLSDGARPWIDFAPGPRSPKAESRARERAAHWSERARNENLTAAAFGIAKRTAPEAIEGDAKLAMQAWMKTWLTARRAKGQTSTRENDSHYRKHIEPVMGGAHVRDWTADDLRALSRDLDEKVSRGVMKWKSAVNVWGTASKMCTDAVRSKLDELRCRTDNPAAAVEGPARGARTVKQYLYP